MFDKAISDRYAGALLSVAPSLEVVDKFDNELDWLIDFDERDHNLIRLLAHPQIEIPKKKEVAIRVLKDQLSKDVMSLILLMIDKKRGNLIIEVAKRFSQLADEVRGVEKGLLITAIPIPDQLFNRIEQGVQKYSERKIVLQHMVDPSIIGGAIVKLGNLVIDGSVRYRLQRFREAMLKVTMPG